jgi:ssDNA-binding Zn-finger/Zn-ribbon topoisomerase 1
VLEPGVDPKSVLCPYFKAKQCTRGDKCKYSHDQSVGRKGAKLDVYQDRRAQEETNESWDEEKLRSVVGEKHAGQKVQSTIICKFFIEAVREKKYGWFWECPNGETCHYRHALPPGFVLEKKKTGEEEEVEETPLEEILEMERAKLGGQGTPVTLERFQAWKESRQKKRDEAAAKEKALRDRDIAAGRAQNLTGKELLQYRPELFQDDEDPGEGDFDYAALRAQLMAEEDAAAEESVNALEEKERNGKRKILIFWFAQVQGQDGDFRHGYR